MEGGNAWKSIDVSATHFPGMQNKRADGPIFIMLGPQNTQTYYKTRETTVKIYRLGQGEPWASRPNDGPLTGIEMSVRWEVASMSFGMW